MPSGRIAKLNWTPSFGQYTVTINKKLYRLGTDKAEAEKQFRFLQTKTDMAEEITAVPTSTRSAVGSRTLPRVDTWCHRRATNPSTQSVAPSTASRMAAATG